VEIDIYSDVVCPWCYIGKRRLEQALESYDGDVTIRFRPFQLDARPVEKPEPLVESLAAKFGGHERARQIFEHTTGAAAQSGLTLHFDHAISANTFDAHRLVWFATSRGRAAEMIDALYQAHFTDGLDVGSRAALASLATGVGMDEAEVRGFLDSSAGEAEVRAEIDAGRDLGVTSVPTFVFAGKYVVTGAQEPETLRRVLDEVSRREAADTVLRTVGGPGDGPSPKAGECADDSCAV
jgi:predicted DsbA family dithiol-disulfide isomerase